MSRPFLGATPQLLVMKLLLTKIEYLKEKKGIDEVQKLLVSFNNTWTLVVQSDSINFKLVSVLLTYTIPTLHNEEGLFLISSLFKTSVGISNLVANLDLAIKAGNHSVAI